MVGEFLESLVSDPINERYRVDMILGQLDWPNIDEYQQIGSLSPGQKMKLYLAQIMITEPTVLLLDEPTNHLDIRGIEWLERFVKRFSGVVVLISHDRDFLNNVVNVIFELDDHSLNIFYGNYDEYLDQKIAWIEEKAMRYRLQERKRAQLDDLLARARGIKDGKRRSQAVKAAKSRLEREVTSKEMDKYRQVKLNGLELAGKVYDTKQILRVKNLSFGYTDDLLLDNTSFELYGAEKLWLYGANGIGKTTFLKLLIDQLPPKEGQIGWGENINWVYFSQEQSHLPLDRELAEYFMEQTGIDFNRSFGVLEKFLFPKSMRHQKIGDLSPGQRARLSFAIFAQQEYDCLVLDEPTNHLDLMTKDVILEALQDFKGAIILVSHDRAFARDLCDGRKVTIRDKQIVVC